MRGALRSDRGGGGARGEDMGGQAPRGEDERGGGGRGGGRARSDRGRYADAPPPGHYYYDDAEYHGSGDGAERGAMTYGSMRSRAHPSGSTSNADWYYSAEPADSPPTGSAVNTRSRYPSPSSGSRFGGLHGPPINNHEVTALRSSTLEALLRGGARAGGGGGGGQGGGRGGRDMAPSSSSSTGRHVDGGDAPPRAMAMGMAAGPLGPSVGVTTGTVGERQPAATKPRGRSTPYLTESNRQDIMERIRRGEKQADLAKEYNVSRAAITNLKQRRQMLEMLENSSNVKDREEALKRRRLSHGNPAGGGGGVNGGLSAVEGLAEDGPRGPRRTQLHVRDARLRSGSDGHNSDDSAGGSSTESSARGGSSGRRKVPFRGGGEAGGGGENADAGGDDRDAASPSYATATAATTPIVTALALVRPTGHRELNAQTTSRLLSTLLEPMTPDGAFRSAATRHTRLLLEETIGWSFSRAPERYEPFALAYGGDEAAVLLTEYLQMEPASASASLRSVQQREAGAEIEIVVRVPAAALRHGPVFVFLDDLVDVVEERGAAVGDTTMNGFNHSIEALAPADSPSICVSGSATPKSETAATTAPTPAAATTPQGPPTTPPATRDVLFLLHSLVFGGLAESEIVVAVALCDARAAREIGRRFPEVQLVATKFLNDQAPTHERQLVAAYRARRRGLLRGLPRVTAGALPPQ